MIRLELEDIENIISEYGNVIYKFCIKLTQNKEDLYQQTFLKAVELRHKLDKNNNPRSFLVPVAIIPSFITCFIQNGLCEEILFRGFIGKN
ncbi:hypothetical protein EAI30_16455 [Romboutsia ilealis]|nr:hypothetical protein [Romboutsia ilealis]